MPICQRLSVVDWLLGFPSSTRDRFIIAKDARRRDHCPEIPEIGEMSALRRENELIRMERVHLKRKLTAVLLADVVGYSRLMSVDEEGTHIRLADCVKTVIEPTVALHEGRLLRSKGDGLLVEFDSAVNAVNCAVDIQRGLFTYDDAAGDRKLQLRIGINSGDVIVQDNDIYGNSVNIAARLEGLAEPGGISVTAAVREQLRGHPGLLFEDTGDRSVKNIDRPIRVYRVTSASSQESGTFSDTPRIFGRLFAGRMFRLSRASIFSVGVVAMVTTVGIAGLPSWHRLPLLSSQASVMVLPFRNLNGPSDDYFADAVTDDLTTDLSRLADTVVIARATAFTYKGKEVDARQIGQDCDVRYLLEGSIRKIGTKVQANTHLVDARSARAIWVDQFDSDVTDLFDLQEAVTGRIASSLGLQLVKAESRRRDRSTDLNAIDMRLRAMAILIDAITPKHNLLARKYLQDSLQLSPQSAIGWSQLADVFMRDYLNRWNEAADSAEARADLLKQAEYSLQQAFSLDPTIALSHMDDGFIRRAKGDHQGALNAFERALALDPNLALAYA